MLVESFILKRSWGLITVSNYLKSIYKKKRKNIKQPFISMYNLPNFKNIENIKRSKVTRDYILYVGNLGSEMLGVNNLIYNYNSIWDDYRTKLIIIGDGKIKTDLDDLIKKLKMKEAVEMKGFLKHEEVIKYIFNSKICIIPYLETPQLEYLSNKIVRIY